QADGEVSETESNCSAVSGFQTPLFVRVTRRRQIIVPYQPDSPNKKRHDKTAFLNKISKILGEDDVSEAESCSSAVSGVQITDVARTTRRRQSKKKLQPDTVCEVQGEEISDAESCCLSSKLEPSITTKRITRSMQIKSQLENKPVAISDSIPAAELVSDAEDASSVIEDGKEPSSPKSKSASTTQSEDVEEEVLNGRMPSNLAKMKQSNTESPGKKAIKTPQAAVVDDSEEECSQIQEHPKQFLESQGQITPNESKKITECRRAGAETAAQEACTHAGELRKGERSSAVSSPPKDTVVAQRTDRCRKISVSSAGDQTGESAESVFHSSERSSSGNNSFALFLTKDESDESENSGMGDIDAVEDNLCYKEADQRAPSLNKSLKKDSLHAEGLFVIDTEPGMSSSQKYYLDQVDQDCDAESKHEGSEKVERSSDLEEAEEELIDEDGKDEDDDFLKNKRDILHLSSSIDPGLNIKKLGGLYISFDTKQKKQKPISSVMKKLKNKKEDQLLQKSIITPDFEKKECVPPFRQSLHQLKKQHRAEREKTTGDGWFGMKAPEITSELKNDLKVLKMRASLDPKHFYKKNDRDGLPKYFQVGTVVDSPIDFYHSRIPKKQRKRTIVDELLADSEFRRYNKKKYQEIMSERAAFAAGKRNRKKKKFHN
ncbi:Deoxynucleotidyltransferase terminal-interacting protein 2, partial [Calypte anna]